MARSGSEYGFIDINGDIAVSQKWSEVSDYGADVAFARSSSGNSYIIDKVGEKIATLSSKQYGTAYSEGYALIRDGSEVYYFNSKAQTAYKTRYQDGLSFVGGYAAVQLDGKWGYIDTRGSLEIANKYRDARSFSNGLAAVLDDETGLWGYISTSGEYVIQPQFDTAEPFSEGYALVSQNGEYSLINKSAELTHMYFK